MSKLGNINRIHRYLGEFSVIDYACYGADELPKGKLDLSFNRCEKKIYVSQGDMVYGTLKLNEMEQRYIFAILSSGMNLLECSRAPSDDKTPMDQKFKVGLWMKCLPFGCIPSNTCVEVNAKNKVDEEKVTLKIYRNKVKKNSGERIKAEDFDNYELTKDKHTLLMKLDNSEVVKVECNNCSIQKIQDFIGLFKECENEPDNNCC